MLQLKIFHLIFPKAASVAISFHKVNVRDSYLVVLQYKKIFGLGAANPFKPITGDSEEDFVKDAKRVLQIPLDPVKNTLAELHEFLGERIFSRTLMSAIDAAYHDLRGQLQDIPVYKIYAKKPKFVNNSITVFIKDTIEETANEAVRIYNSVKDLKILKIKLKGFSDIERVTAIRNVSPPDMKFVVDANQAYKDTEEAVRVLTEVGKILGKVILVEEPCPKGELDKLRFVKEHLKKIMVFADESMTSLDDVKKIVKKKAAHGINIKLQKVGGIYPAVEIAQYCQKQGLKFMVGAMIEDFVGLTADAHFAVSQKNAILTDLDTDLDIPKYITGGSYLEGGKRLVLDRPGFGFDFKQEGLGKFGEELKFEQII